MEMSFHYAREQMVPENQLIIHSLLFLHRVLKQFRKF